MAAGYMLPSLPATPHSLLAPICGPGASISLGLGPLAVYPLPSLLQLWIPPLVPLGSLDQASPLQGILHALRPHPGHSVHPWPCWYLALLPLLPLSVGYAPSSGLCPCLCVPFLPPACCLPLDVSGPHWLGPFIWIWVSPCHSHPSSTKGPLLDS